MASVVVGVHHPGPTAAVRWAAAQAELHAAELTLVHAWKEPIDITVDVEAALLPGVEHTAHSHAEPGRAARVLLSQPADLLVLGGHAGGPHLRQLARLCLHQAQCPVAVVPDTAGVEVRRVVVGVEPSAGSTTALVWALDFAERLNAGLTVVHAWQRSVRSLDTLVHPRRARVAQAAAVEEGLRRWVLETLAPEVPDEISAVNGAPLDSLLAAVGADDVLVLGRPRRHQGLGHVLHGELTHDLAALAPCTVVVVPSGP